MTEEKNKDFESKDCEHQEYDSRYQGVESPIVKFNYCPWCGKDLREEKKDD